MIGFNYGDSSSDKEHIYPERDPVAAHSDIRLDLFLCWQTIAVEMTLTIAIAIALGGCAAQHLNAAQYTRTDGKPVDPAHQQATLAQCKGEAVSAPPDPQCFDCGWKEKTIIAACMARNGYIQAKQ